MFHFSTSTIQGNKTRNLQDFESLLCLLIEMQTQNVII